MTFSIRHMPEATPNINSSLMAEQKRSENEIFSEFLLLLHNLLLIVVNFTELLIDESMPQSIYFAFL